MYYAESNLLQQTDDLTLGVGVQDLQDFQD